MRTPLITALLALSCSGPVLAQEETAVSSATAPAEISTAAVTAPPDGPEEPQPLPQKIHRHILFLDDISEGMSIFNSFFRRMDSDLSGNAVEGRNKTAVSLQLKAASSKYGGERVIPRLDVRVDMPKTLRRLKLVLEHAPEEDNSLSASEERIARGQAPGERTSIGTAIKFALTRFVEEDVHVGSQVRIGNRRPFIVFVKSRLSADVELSKLWDARAFAQAGWYSDPWLNLSCGLYVSRHLPRYAALSFNFSAETPTNNKKIDMYETVALTKQLSLNDSLGLAVQLHSVNVPVTRAEDYSVALPYRRNLYNAWFYGELAPGILYARSNSFRADPNIHLKFSMRFGGPPASGT